MPARAIKKTEQLVRAVGQRALADPAPRPRHRNLFGSAHRTGVAAKAAGEPILEAEIALSYGVSRTPVREAILKSSDEGLVDIFQQSGIFVSRIPLAALPEAIIIRKALEETQARSAAQRADLQPDPRSAFGPRTSARGSAAGEFARPFTRPMRHSRTIAEVGETQASGNYRR